MSHPDHCDPAKLRALLDGNPQQPKVWLALARIQIRQGLPGEAERSLRQALSLDETLDAARLELAQLLVRNGHPGPGIVQVQRLLERNPRNAEAWLVAGEAFRENFQPAEATAAFAQACEIAPGHEGAAFARASFMVQRGDADPAQNIIKNFLNGQSKSGEQWRHLHAVAQHELGGPAAAKAALDKALVDHPNSAVLHALAAKVCHQLGEPTWAQNLIAAAQRENAHGAVILAAAAALRGASQTDEAQSLLEYCLNQTVDASNDDSRRELWLELADCHLSRANFSQGLSAARTAESFNKSEQGLPTRQLTDALLSMGHIDEALGLIRKMRQLLPEENRWLAAESTALRALGDSEGDQLFDCQRLVWVKDMPMDMWRAIKPALVDELHNAHKGAGPLLDQSLRGGTQTSGSLLISTAPAIGRLLEYFLASVREYHAQLQRRDDHPFDQRLSGEPVLTGCWSVRLTSGGFHVNHLHSQGTLSSAFYVSVPSCIDATESSAPDRSGWLALGAPRFPVPGVEATHWVQPKPGRLVLFPSWFWHGTVPFTDPEARLSVAFDAIFR